MMLPSILIVDDSDSVLAFERAALSAQFLCTTASNGAEALERLRAAPFNAMLLDLSMPVMGGDEVLRRMAADAALSRIPVIVVSSESHRRAWCLEQGARAFIAKPIVAAELIATLDSVLAEELLRKPKVAILGMQAGGVGFALLLENIVRVLPSLETSPLPWGPSYLSENLDLDGRAVVVLDVASRFDRSPLRAFEDQLLVVARTPGGVLALRVDQVGSPEEVEASALHAPASSGATADQRLTDVMLGFALLQGKALPVLQPVQLVPENLRNQLAAPSRSA